MFLNLVFLFDVFPFFWGCPDIQGHILGNSHVGSALNHFSRIYIHIHIYT